MSKMNKDLDELLLHYGVKGMKWKNKKSDDTTTSEDSGGGSKSPEELKKELDDIGEELKNVRGKVGSGPLDILRYVITGKTKKVDDSKKRKVPDSLDDLGRKIRDIKSKVGNKPLDIIKYIITGKKQIKHSGVMGMKWGVRRNRDRHGGADGKADAKDKPVRSTLGKKWDSLKRERQWHSVLKEMNNLSTKDITTVTKRVALENSLKILSRSKVGTKKDKEDYLRREHMDDQELSRKVTRLRAKEGLHNAVKSASKEQREFGQKVVQIGGSLGVKYAINRTVTMDEMVDIFKNPKSSAGKAKEEAYKVAWAKLKSQNGHR